MGSRKSKCGEGEKKRRKGQEDSNLRIRGYSVNIFQVVSFINWAICRSIDYASLSISKAKNGYPLDEKIKKQIECL